MFEVPQSKKSIRQNRWEFTIPGEDGTFDVPLMKFASIAAMEAFEAGKESTGLILAADNERARDAIRSLDADQVTALLDAWSEASGVTVGESQGSPAS